VVSGDLLALELSNHFTTRFWKDLVQHNGSYWDFVQVSLNHSGAGNVNKQDALRVENL
jgi:hypothetical protein